MIKSLLNSLDQSIYEHIEGVRYVDSDTIEITLEIVRSESEFVEYKVNVFDTGEFDVEVKHHLDFDEDVYQYVDKDDLKILERLGSDINYWSKYSSYCKKETTDE